MNQDNNLEIQQHRLDFFKNKIKETLSEIKDDLGKRYNLYISMVETCESYDELREMAELELQIDMIQYTKQEIQAPLTESDTDIKELRMVSDVAYRNIAETNTSKGEYVEDIVAQMDDDELTNAMANMIMMRVMTEPLEEKQCLYSQDINATTLEEDIDGIDTDDMWGDPSETGETEEDNGLSDGNEEDGNEDETEGDEFNLEDSDLDSYDNTDGDEFDLNEEDLGDEFESDDELGLDDIELEPEELDSYDESDEFDLSEEDLDAELGLDDTEQDESEKDSDEFDIDEEDILGESLDEFETDESDDGESADDSDEFDIEEEDILGEILEESDEFEDTDDEDFGLSDEIDEFDIEEEDLGEYTDEDANQDFDIDSIEFDEADNEDEDFVLDDIDTYFEKGIPKKNENSQDKPKQTVKKTVTPHNIFDNGTNRGKQTQKMMDFMLSASEKTDSVISKVVDKTKEQGKNIGTSLKNSKLFDLSMENDTDFLDF